MKKILIISGVLCLGLGLFALGYFFRPLVLKFSLPYVLVEVNGIKITDADLKQEMRFLQVSENTPLSSITQEDVLDRMINDTLILMEARRLQLRLPEKRIDGYLKQFWQGYSAEEVEAIIQQHHFSKATWKELIERRLLIEETIKRAVEDQVYIGEDEVEDYYWSHVLEFYRQVRVLARQIVVETLEQAVALKQKLDAGEDFKLLAKKFSRGPEKDQGGELGWVGAEEVPKAFSRILFRMSPGEISQPVATEYGFHIFLLEKREQGGKIPLEEAKKMIIDKLKQDKINRAFEAWLENLRARANIIIRDRRGVE